MTSVLVVNVGSSSLKLSVLGEADRIEGALAPLHQPRALAGMGIQQETGCVDCRLHRGGCRVNAVNARIHRTGHTGTNTNMILRELPKINLG